MRRNPDIEYNNKYVIIATIVISAIVLFVAFSPDKNASHGQYAEPSVQGASGAGEVTDYNYGHVIKEAIRAQAGTREISFGFAPTYQREASPVYEQKWEIKYEHATAYGYAKVRYNGGDPKDLNSWTVLQCYIDE